GSRRHHPRIVSGALGVTGRRRITLIAGAVAAIALVAAGVVALLLNREGPPVAEPVTITIREGERLGVVAQRLADQGVGRTPALFVLWARITRLDREVHWGEFRIATPLSPRQLLARLVGPPDALHAITIPEGRTVRQVVAMLATAGLGSEDSFRRLLDDPHFLAAEGLPPDGPEGYLFPDTYSFPLATPPDRVLSTMVRRFHEVFTDEMAARAASIGLTTRQAVTLASLVEEETGRPEERPLVAAV